MTISNFQDFRTVYKDMGLAIENCSDIFHNEKAPVLEDEIAIVTVFKSLLTKNPDRFYEILKYGRKTRMLWSPDADAYLFNPAQTIFFLGKSFPFYGSNTPANDTKLYFLYISNNCYEWA